MFVASHAILPDILSEIIDVANMTTCIRKLLEVFLPSLFPVSGWASFLNYFWNDNVQRKAYEEREDREDREREKNTRLRKLYMYLKFM